MKPTTKFIAIASFICSLYCCSESSEPAISPSDSKLASTISMVSNSEQLKHELREFFSIQKIYPTNYLIGDFNGDGYSDQLFVVVINEGISALPSEIDMQFPWRLNDGVEISDNVTSGAQNNLLIIHGESNKAVLLRDRNPISVLDSEAAQELLIIKNADLALTGEPELQEQSRGDILVIPTEAGIDTYLYWDGTQYRVFESFEIP